MNPESKTPNASNSDFNPEDPISGEPNTLPVETSSGTASEGTNSENIDPTVENAYWRASYEVQPYYSGSYSYEDYEPAYRAGWESYDPTQSADWKDRESIAKGRWESEGGTPSMTWEEAKQASKDAFSRVHERNRNKPR